jgi:uncharacterized protein with von Willebrand factor type A (vWA) domain
MMQQSKCLPIGLDDDTTLSEVSHLRNRSLEDLLRQVEFGESSLREKVGRFAKQRLQEKQRQQAEYVQRLKQYEEQLSYQVVDGVYQEQDVDDIIEKIAADALWQELTQKVRQLKYQPNELTTEDVESSLQEYIERGELKIEDGKIKITPKGARKLANQILRRILKNLGDPQLGPHGMEQTGYGAWISLTSRNYEVGDEYARIDFEKTLLNALERKPRTGNKIGLEPEDFQFFEEIHQTKMVAGIIIDQSGSMRGDKFNAAIDTSLALAELIRREPEDILKVYLFSHEVEEIPYYDIVNVGAPQGFTDVKAALHAFRKGTSTVQGDKQAYLITDSEPNTENGRFVGFDKAAAGVVQEALYYRKSGITLNLIMLDESAKLKQLASLLARQSIGRVFFTCPMKLQGVIIEDYLSYKKKMVKSLG